LSILLLYQVLTRPPVPTLFPYTTLFRSPRDEEAPPARALLRVRGGRHAQPAGCAAARGDRIGRGAVHDRRRDRRRLAGIIHERLASVSAGVAHHERLGDRPEIVRGACVYAVHTSRAARGV